MGWEACWAIGEMCPRKLQKKWNKKKALSSSLAYISSSAHHQPTEGEAEEAWSFVGAFHLIEPSQNISKYSGETWGFPEWAFVCVCGLWSNSCHSIILPLISGCQEPKLWPVWELWMSRWPSRHMELMEGKPRGGGQMPTRRQEGQVQGQLELQSPKYIIDCFTLIWLHWF